MLEEVLLRMVRAAEKQNALESAPNSRIQNRNIEYDDVPIPATSSSASGSSVLEGNTRAVQTTVTTTIVTTVVVTTVITGDGSIADP